MFNPISYGQDTVLNTTATITLGFGPGNMAPPRLLLMNVTQGATVNLPPISTGEPSVPGTLTAAVGVADGFVLTIKSLTNNPVTITPNGSDAADTIVLGAAGLVTNLIASVPGAKWYVVAGGGGESRTTNRLVTGNATLAVSDRYLLDTASGTITLQTAALYPSYAPYTIVRDISGATTLTVSPTSPALINAVNLASISSASGTFYTDGTNWFQIG